MNEQQSLVDIEKQSALLRKETLYRDGDQIERDIISGKETFLGEIDRMRLRYLVEGAGVNLLPIEGKADLSAQADQLVTALGKDRLVTMTTAVVGEVVKNPAGEVFKGESVKPENAEEEVANFVTEYLVEQLKKKEFVFDPKKYGVPKESWKKNTVYRIEAVMSVVNKLLWILQADDETEGKRRQNTPGTLKHLRERVLRGAEKSGEVIDESVTRHPDKIIRYLPPKSMGVILEHLTRV